MNWTADMMMLFGEWALLMLIPLLIGLLTGWFLWYRGWKRSSVAKDRLEKELNNSRAEVDTMALARSEDVQSMRLKLQECRNEYDGKLIEMNNELDQSKAAHKACMDERAALEASHESEIEAISEKLAEAAVEKEKLAALRKDEIDGLMKDLAKVKAEKEAIEKRNNERIQTLESALEEGRRVLRKLNNKEPVQVTLDIMEGKDSE